MKVRIICEDKVIFEPITIGGVTCESPWFGYIIREVGGFFDRRESTTTCGDESFMPVVGDMLTLGTKGYEEKANSYRVISREIQSLNHLGTLQYTQMAILRVEMI